MMTPESQSSAQLPIITERNLGKNLNAGSLKNKLIAFKYDVDIIAVSETWFNSLTSPAAAGTSLVGFQTPFRQDRADTKRGGGVLYVHICHRRYRMHKKSGSGTNMDVEVVVIEVLSLPHLGVSKNHHGSLLAAIGLRQQNSIRFS